jgi:hypothetical protein
MGPDDVVTAVAGLSARVDDLGEQAEGQGSVGDEGQMGVNRLAGPPRCLAAGLRTFLERLDEGRDAVSVLAVALEIRIDFAGAIDATLAPSTRMAFFVTVTARPGVALRSAVAVGS